ncbi:hypothetical protein FIBSPDRAFT_1037451 [Athelia psychrophila]|uniref:Nephrocystin 3-like N-terminal domain-containing protein n=1 Tax=Athelia psychrophila TaxID=1759441 RepID=A0A166U997_9AGAM|nr:hypothetical protein FIBSPDRAFT_1037451 [Fibularhizoctonia sp. CBS 109695]
MPNSMDDLEKFFGAIWDKFRRKERLSVQKPPWPSWDLDPKFFQAMSQWTMDNPESSLDRVLDNVCTALEKSDSVMQFIPDSPFPARSLVTALVYLLRLGINISTAKSHVQEFAKEVVHWISQLQTASITSKRARFSRATRKNLSHVLINEICTWATARLNDGRWSGIKHGLAIDKEVEDFKIRIASARALFLDLSCIEVAKGIDAILDEIEMVRQHQEDQLQGIHDKLDAQEQARARKEYLQKMLQTVSNPTYSHQGKKPCDAGTRVEVLAEIEKWKNDRSKNSQGFLWLTGEPGAGKSAITATIARDCKDDGTLWAQFFINRNNAETTDPKLYFPSIARQFIDHSSHSDVEIAIVAALKSRPSLLDNISIEQVSQLFLVALKIACDSDRERPVVVVVDGLDETDQSKLADTAQILSQIFNSLTSCNAKILISSRTDDEIRRPFAKMMDPRHVKHIHLDTNAPSSIRDVSAYIIKRISQIVEENDLNWNTWPGEIRMKALCHRASGLFIWAVTVVKFFQDQIRILGKECLNDLLDAVSVKGMGDINNLYWTILQLAYKSCDDDWRFETFRRIVGCVTALKEPLTIAAIAELLDLRRDPFSDPVDIVVFFRQTRTVLVAGADAIDDQTVPRLHRSFFEFITSDRAEKKFRVDLRFSNGELALQSIRQLTKISNPRENSRTPELRYAIQFWGLHLSQRGDIPSGVCIIGNLARLQVGHTSCKTALETRLRSLTWPRCNPMGLSVPLKREEVQLFHSEGQLSQWCDKPKSARCNGYVTSACISSYAILTACYNDNTIYFWDPSTLLRLEGIHLAGGRDVEGFSFIAISLDEKRVAAVCTNGAVCLWDFQTRQLVCPTMESGIPGFNTSLSLSFSSDSQCLTLACIEGPTSVWDAFDGSPVGSNLGLHEQLDLLIAHSPLFDLENGWSTPVATLQSSQFGTPGQHYEQMQWIPSNNPDGGLWAYMDNRLICGSGTGFVTIIEESSHFERTHNFFT